MNFQAETFPLTRNALADIIDQAARQIPPLWPLDSHVAVNPYIGQTHLRLAEAAALMARTGGGSVTMTRQWYLDRIANGTITDADLGAALRACPYPAKPVTLDALRQNLTGQKPQVKAQPTVADLSAAASGTDWPGLVADRIGIWAASHFDAGQALWISSQGKSAWRAYRIYASHDITPEIIGLKGFAAFVAEAPDSALEAAARCVNRLGLVEAALASYLHQLLLSLGGWAQLARYRVWRAEQSDGTDTTLTDLLTIRLLWEDALYTQYESDIAQEWANIRTAHTAPIKPDDIGIIDEILQESAERATQRALGERLSDSPINISEAERPLLQAAFCIDVRSEVFRRALETCGPDIKTLGFAGFFGIPVKHRRFASDITELRLPVLLNPTVQSCAVQSCASGPENMSADRHGRVKARAKRAWGRFKLAAVSSFAFVEAMGPVYVVKLLRDALRLKRSSPPRDPKPRFDPELDQAARIKAAGTVLRAMSLTRNFARIIVLAGHGAHVVNNPHASGLACGACGGYSGEVNARLLAALLNDGSVRAGLAEDGISIPDDTLFVAALHDTTTDRVTLYDGDTDVSAHKADVKQVKSWFEIAGKLARRERALRLPRAGTGSRITDRGRDWAEVRPEWGLAGCQAFIAAPRARTAGRDLEGRAFLHDYDWRHDSTNGFAILELIITAPVVVASWISLQYYGSTVAPDVFGAGNKLLHNVVGGIGVVEGNGGLIRSGLPWQSVHDGQRYSHEPLRLSVYIEAPHEAMTEILSRHDDVRALFDNGWLHLFALNETGRMAWRYAGNLSWTDEP